HAHRDPGPRVPDRAGSRVRDPRAAVRLPGAGRGAADHGRADAGRGGAQPRRVLAARDVPGGRPQPALGPGQRLVPHARPGVRRVHGVQAARLPAVRGVDRDHLRLARPGVGRGVDPQPAAHLAAAARGLHRVREGEEVTSKVEFRALRRVYGRTTALDGLDLTIEPGRLVALLGPSGCGKTTALRCVAGYEQPDSGAVLIDGKDITGVPANKRDAGMVFQSYSLFPNLNARDNVAFGLRVRKVPAAVRRAKADELLELVGLPHHADRYPHQLSGGQQQRVALARALALEPRVLLLDEPLSALDAKVRVALREEIRRLQLDLGITTIFVTHDQEEALSIADEVAVLRDGRLEQVGPPAEVYDRPATPFVAEFVGTMNHL